MNVLAKVEPGGFPRSCSESRIDAVNCGADEIQVLPVVDDRPPRLSRSTCISVIQYRSESMIN
jgi:hypothetical protein